MGQDARQRWQQRFDAALAAGKVRDADFTTLSGVEVDPVYGPADEAAVPGFERIGYPGEFPFTRGLHATGYRGRAWTIRQFAGFGNAEQTNEAMLAALRSSVPEGGRLVADSVATRREDGAVALGRQVQFTMTAMAEYVVPIDAGEVSSAIAGKTPEQALAIVSTQWPLARPPEIYRDPEWLETLPTFPSRIQVRIDYGDSLAAQ